MKKYKLKVGEDIGSELTITKDDTFRTVGDKCASDNKNINSTANHLNGNCSEIFNDTSLQTFQNEVSCLDAVRKYDSFEAFCQDHCLDISREELIYSLKESLVAVAQLSNLLGVSMSQLAGEAISSKK